MKLWYDGALHVLTTLVQALIIVKFSKILLSSGSLNPLTLPRLNDH